MDCSFVGNFVENWASGVLIDKVGDNVSDKGME